MSHRPPSRAPLSRILSPRSVAVIGASEHTAKFGGRVLHHLLKHGYRGRIVPINPRRESLLGIATAASIDKAGPVDVAVIAVPAATVVETVAACAASDVAACVIITAQMGEIGGEGKEREQRIVEIAQQSGMRLIGPNCLGLVDAHLRMALTASFAMGVDRLPEGGLAVVSQSGALMATMFNAGFDCGAGFSKLVSIGNQADVTENEVFETLLGDEATRGFAIYVEGFSDAGRFLELARRARADGKPVVTVKVGSSEAGRSAAFSHTASLCGSHRLFEAAARKAGIVLCDDTEASVIVADALLRWPGGLRSGQGIAAISGSGGGAGILADRLVAAGLPLAEPSSATRSILGSLTPSGRGGLPLDAGGLRPSDVTTHLAIALRAIAEDPATGALVYLMTTQPAMPEVAELLATIERETAKPVLLVLTAGSVADGLRARLREQRAFHCDKVDDALRVLRGLLEHAAWTHRPDNVAADRHPGKAADELAPGVLDWEACAGLARSAGLSVAESVLVTREADVPAAALRLGFPLVLKAVGPSMVHKTEHGGVMLGIAGIEAATAAFRQLSDDLGAGLSGVLLQHQHTGVAELILGILSDWQLGPFVMVGAGGVLAELLEDTAIAPAPLSLAQAHALISRLRLFPVLSGFRGRPPADLDSLARAIVATGRLAADRWPVLSEFEINPLIVGRPGEGCVAVDIRGRID